MEPPSPPSVEERNFYYYGLPSCPRLVARSSTHAWENPHRYDTTTFPPSVNMYKSLRPAAGDPLLHRLWNDATSSLRIQILEAVSVSDWTAVDILRLGWTGEFHTTLLVSVKPESLTWSEAHPITIRCKEILEEHGISNIHCEIRESLVTSCGNAPSATRSATTADTPNHFQLFSAHFKGLTQYICKDSADLSDCLGTKISMKDDDARSGTKGIYLALKSSNTKNHPKIVALTCRHVVVNHETEGIQSYRHQEFQPSREVIQIDQPTYSRRLERYELYVKNDRNHAQAFRDCDDTESAATYETMADDMEDFVRKMRPYVASSSRVFGTLLYSPAFAFAPAQREAPGNGPWQRDWALIELLPSRHQAQLGTLKNKVFVGRHDRIASLLFRNTRGWEELAGLMVPIPRDCTITLTNDVVPMSELYKPANNARNDEPAMVMVKYGASEELTIGLGNTLKSLVRREETLDGHMEGYSEEWAITSLSSTGQKQTAFSFKGDSGSCVWDMERRPAGIIMAGVHHPAPNGNDDVTYAQPLERLLGDIKDHGFDVSLI
ncbi:hypothetical protein M441DRAFT_70020 [Trichoderma asperellum CBS 433.97]|uniref:Serine protease n=2 Tax=Trichoderma asperellum TaxID=101201 RepID=A0A2T3Z5V1_TRIA4|nr:hypothetical protein M441DRAFT_70020 [Trichoderma asperellum CBS 433.97]PTB40189.1 hypothetical protein M441DRAFT_70020 [Trichoderma asperellum CBS 433.97]